MTGRSRQILILNASVVIELVEMSLIEALALYKRRKGLRLIVPRQVVEELSEEVKVALQALMRKGLMEICGPPEYIFRQLRGIYLGLGDGELGVMALTLHLRSSGVEAIPILDDKKARRVARDELGLTPHGTLWLVKQMAEAGSLDRNKAIDIIRGLRSRGFYITDDVVKGVVNQLLRTSGK